MSEEVKNSGQNQSEELSTSSSQHGEHHHHHHHKHFHTKTKFAIGWGLTVLSAIAGALLMYMLHSSHMLPGLYTGLAYLVIIMFIVFARWMLMFRRRHIAKPRYFAGIAITLIITLLFGGASYYMYSPLKALKSITGDTVQVTTYGVYVPVESSAESVKDIKNASVAVMNTDGESDRIAKVAKMIESETGAGVNTVPYEDMFSTVKAVLDGDTNAMILNTGFYDMLTDTQEVETTDEVVVDSDATVADDSKEAVTDESGVLGLGSKVKCIATYDVTEEIKESTGDDKVDSEKREAGTFTVLISGSDTRGSLNSVGRNDVNIIATINPNTKTILLVNTPRDYFVPLSISNGKKDKLTHAGIYGEQVSMDTLSMLYSTKIDYSFRINFVGFKKVIDSLGGVTVHSDYDFSAGGYHYVKGDNHVNGEQALAFARERHAFAEGDNQRGKDQMYVIEAVINKMMSPALLKNYDKLWTSLSDTFTTSVPYDTVSGMVADQLADNSKWTVKQYAVTGTGSKSTTYSMPSTYSYVMIPNEGDVTKAKGYIDAVEQGKNFVIE